jgi:hypothetical protein
MGNAAIQKWPKNLPRRAMIRVAHEHKGWMPPPEFLDKRFWQCFRCGWDARDEPTWDWFRNLHPSTRSELEKLSKEIVAERASRNASFVAAEVTRIYRTMAA